MIVLMLLALAYVISLSILVLSQAANQLAGKALFITNIVLTLWLTLIFGLQTEISHSVLYARTVFVFGFLSVAALVWFMVIVAGVSTFRAIGLILLGLGLLVGSLCLATDTIISDLYVDQDIGLPVPVYGTLAGLYITLLAFIVLSTVMTVVLKLRLRAPEQAKQIKIVSLSITISIVGGLVTNLILPALLNGDTRSALLLPVSILVLMSGLTYAIVRHQLFDIRRTVIRTAAYTLSVILLAGIYYGSIYALSVGISALGLSGDISAPDAVSIALAIALAFLFQPIKRFFDHVTNRLFFRKEYDSEVLYAEFGKILAYNTDLMQMVGRATTYLVNTIRVERALFYVVGRGCLVRRPMAIDQVSDRDMEKVYRYIIRHKLKQAVLGDMLSEAGAVVVQKALRRREIQVLLPLWLGGDLLGVLLLGEHQGRGYVTRDLRVLNSIANEFAIAIQNSLSVEEIRQFNTTLQQRIEVATRELRETNLQLQRLDETKDEFISMASHQLRTPLTSIKGYISMLLDGDAGRVSAMQRRFLAEAFASSDRMVHLINDFLNVSRLRTGKFVLDRQPVDFLAIVREEVEGLQPIADQRQLEVVLRAPDVGPIITIDEHKLRQVVMNLIDNAIYYTRIESQILVKVAVSRRSVVLTVTDQGIGVPADEQPRLFGKFFRATNARRQRPDGTGIGLFLAQQVVAAHGGHMIFSSTEGKGSTFGFRLPRQ